MKDEDKLNKFNAELGRFNEIMRDDQGTKKCTILQFKHLAGPEIVAFCVLKEDFLPTWKTLLNNVYDQASLDANMKTQVSVATTSDAFNIDLIIDGSSSKHMVTPGAESLLDDQKNQKVLEYNTIAHDKYDNRCAFWYKHLQETPGPVSNHNVDCCFTFNNIENKEVYICQDDAHHCILRSKELLKSMREGCLGTLELQNGPSVNGEPGESDDTEVTGQVQTGIKYEEKEKQ